MSEIKKMPKGYQRLFCPFVGSDDYKAIEDVFTDKWLGIGKYVEEFEAACGEYLGVDKKRLVAVNSGTAALNIAVRCLPISTGSIIAVPSLTFASSATAILNGGHTPFFVDVDEDNCTISVKELEKIKKAGCRALVMVHFGGNTRGIHEIERFCHDNSIYLIEDCAHTFCTKTDGRYAGTFGDFGSYSFEEKKVMTCGDGGLLYCKDQHTADLARRLRWVGIDKDTWARSDVKKNNNHWYYEINELGDKLNMNNYSAILGLSQIGKIETINQRRNEVIGWYLGGLKGLNVKTLIPYILNRDNSYWLFGIRVKERDRLIECFKKAGIASGVHYTPLHRQPLFRHYPKASSLETSEKIYSECVTLPLHCWLTAEEVSYIVNEVKEFMQ